ncbi:MAG: YbaB/EbfC family nucleoid-associated protein [Bdellovibrionota bacterium]
MPDSNSPGGFGALFQQAQQIARDMEQKRKEIEEGLSRLTVEASSGGGMVRVVAGADGTIREVKIDPAAVDPRDVKMLEDLLLAAINEGLRRAAERAEEERGKLLTSLPLPPGLDLSGLLGKLR